MKRLIFPALCLAVAVYYYLQAGELTAEVARLTVPPTVASAEAKQEAKISAYISSVGGLYPEVIAAAAMTTFLPEMAAAIALVESNCNPYAIGDSGASRGAWQIQDKHWRHFAGKVSHDPFVQAAQFDAVFTYLLDTRSLPGATSAYNGHGKDYVPKVYTHYLAMTKK